MWVARKRFCGFANAPEADMHLTNQERLYNHMAARPTYPEWDS